MLQNKLKIHKRMILLVVIALTVALAGCGNQGVVATYQGGKVTQAELGKFINMNMFFDPNMAMMMYYPGFENYMMDQLITFKVLSERAEKGVKIEADKMVKEQMDDLEAYFEQMGGRNALDNELQSLDLTKKDMQNFMQLNFYTMNSIRAKIQDNDVTQLYNEIISEDPHYFDVATVRHILIMTDDPTTGEPIRTQAEALERANEVRAKLINNEDFAKLAEEYTDDPGSKGTGGQYTNQRVSVWVPEFRDAAVTLPLEEISEPIEVAYGYHILKVESRMGLPLAEVKPEVESQFSENVVYEFMQNELPGIMISNTLPTQELPEDLDLSDLELPLTD